MKHNNLLLSKYDLNRFLTLKNRIVMAPMTRVQADDHLVPTKAMADYYARRSDAGLIITEGTIIRPDGKGYNNVPGIFNHAQIRGWRHVTDQVHDNNGLIFLQIWHVGRVSHPDFLEGHLPVSPSETMMSQAIPRKKGLFYGRSRSLLLEEIAILIESYATAANNAIKAGFDGVEIHGANGYLIDQFLHYHTNQREDRYGGSIENRARFALEVVKACGTAIGYERVGLRLSPMAYLNEILPDERDKKVFQYLLTALNRYPIAYVHTGNFNDAISFKELDHMTMTTFIRNYYHGHVIGCGSYTPETAAESIAQGDFDLIALGRPFIANPDLINRLQTGNSLNTYHVSMLDTLV